MINRENRSRWHGAKAARRGESEERKEMKRVQFGNQKVKSNA